MIAENYGSMIRIADDCHISSRLIDRDEAMLFIEDLTEAVRMCPVDVERKNDTDNHA